MFVFPGPQPFAWPLTLAPNLCLLTLALHLYLPTLAPNLYLPALVYIITIPRSEICIYRPCLLNLCWYLRPWPTISITAPGPEFAFTLLLVIVASAAAAAAAAVVVIK